VPQRGADGGPCAVTAQSAPQQAKRTRSDLDADLLGSAELPIRPPPADHSQSFAGADTAPGALPGTVPAW